ncbi:VOC family protein [Muricoccus aerilatus]|uniref:VOC family protein n=1 Tax=Muricoccus aerilatus TaxID=452982 RepID=UPI00069410F9|nr:VOC family protein [Roseomonas aerilata]
MDQAPDGQRTPQQGSRLKISEIILKTSRSEEMKAWYRTVLGVAPFFERTPAPGTKPLDLGGQTRASDLKMCFFRLSTDFPYVQTIGIFEEPGIAAQPGKGLPGLHHMQLMCASFEELIRKYEVLDAKGLHPHRSANHGPMTSFYYRDPDGNNVEITAQNQETLEAMAEFMASEAFLRNPSGVELDPAAFVASYRAGTPLEDLLRIPA